MKLSAKLESFDSFWEGPDDVEKGYSTFYQFYKNNYLNLMPDNKNSEVLVISCGPGYFVNMLNQHGYHNVLGIDSDETKMQHARAKNLNCETATAFDFLRKNADSGSSKYDVIVAEQEINHLTLDEIVSFLELCKLNLKDDGMLIIHSLNGANPITGSESLAQNIDHFNTFTEYSLGQVLKHANYRNIKILPLNLYVFYKNPLNYVALLIDRVNTLVFRVFFTLYGKSNKHFTKKIAAVCKK